MKDLVTVFSGENGGVKAVDGISFELLAGETLGIVGESGSGKSVTALSIMQLVPPPGRISSGSISFRPPNSSNDVIELTQQDTASLQKIRGKRIAMIFQEPMTSLNPLLRCGEQIAEGLRLHLGFQGATLKKEVITWLEKVQLQDPERIYKSYPHQLSGGQKQRVMIAMALSCRPDVLIADEPTTALDVTVQRAILDLIDELKKELGTSVIFITHDLGVISHIADRSLVMYQGKIVELGTISKLFQRAEHPYTRGLIACRPPLDHRLVRLPVIADFMKGDAKENTAPTLERISEQADRERLMSLQKQPPLLTVEDLHTWYAAKTTFFGKPTAYTKAVYGVSFQVYPGETLGLVGESGCGKTTLGRSILRLVEPHSGQVVYDGQSVTAASEEELKLLRKDIQIIFQDPYASLNPRMMVGAAVMEPMQVYEIGSSQAGRKAKTMALLEQVGLLPEHFYRYPHEFSGGQRQRICIARALAVNPRFIVCDEPVSALDVSVQAQVLNLLQSLRKEHGLTYIFISHDLSVVKFMSDRIMVMKDGKIVESGPADLIYREPKEDYTKELIAAIL